jgi:hypothetical protein
VNHHATAELDVRCDPHGYNLSHGSAPANGLER